MCSAEAMSDIECDADADMCVSTIDVENCFYQMVLPEAISYCIAFPALSAREAGVSRIGTTLVSLEEPVFPCFSCLFMLLFLAVVFCAERE